MQMSTRLKMRTVSKIVLTVVTMTGEHPGHRKVTLKVQLRMKILARKAKVLSLAKGPQ
jgi:hypothetical protein